MSRPFFALAIVLVAAPCGARPFESLRSATFDALSREAASDPGTLRTMEEAKGVAARSFDGQEPPPVANIQVLSPVEIIDVPGAPRQDPPVEEGNPSYHFKGNTPLPGLTIYKAEKDKPGEDNGTTRGKAPATLGTYVKRGGFGLGLLGLIAGIFFPPALIIGAALIGIGAGFLLSEKLGG